MRARRSSEREAERLLAADLRKAGWKVQREPRIGNLQPDLLVRRGNLMYVVELKSAPEPRRDRVLPLLAQAILQAQAMARALPHAAPLAVVVSPRIPDALADEVRSFARESAPEVAIGVMGLDGFRAFVGPGLEGLGAPREQAPRLIQAKGGAGRNLFSDLNQWLLKVLLAPEIPDNLLSAPRGHYRNASQLARAAGVSVMSASRLVRILVADELLDESHEHLRLVRIPDLMRRWRAVYLRRIHDWPMRWILRRDPAKQLKDALASRIWRERSRSGEEGRSRPGSSPRACLGLYAAADALGLGFVRGVKPHLYVESLRPDVLHNFGLMSVELGPDVDVFVRVPFAPESLFRGMVFRGGVPVSDILQVWADVSGHPSRGEAQAALIERQVLAPFLGKRSRRDGRAGE